MQDPGKEFKRKLYSRFKGKVLVTKCGYPVFLPRVLHWDSSSALQKGWGSARAEEPALVQAFNAVFIALILGVSV